MGQYNTAGSQLRQGWPHVRLNTSLCNVSRGAAVICSTLATSPVTGERMAQPLEQPCVQQTAVLSLPRLVVGTCLAVGRACSGASLAEVCRSPEERPQGIVPHQGVLRPKFRVMRLGEVTSQPRRGRAAQSMRVRAILRRCGYISPKIRQQRADGGFGGPAVPFHPDSEIQISCQVWALQHVPESD